MRAFFYILIWILPICSVSQTIDYRRFNNYHIEKALFEELNRHRGEYGMEPMIFSRIMRDEITSPQLAIIIKEDRLHHPGLDVYLDSTPLLGRISEESFKKTGVSSQTHWSGNPIIGLAENIFWCGWFPDTYQELARICIRGFHNSTSGHREVQLKSYLSGGKGGLVSCRAWFTQSGVYIVFNYASIER